VTSLPPLVRPAIVLFVLLTIMTGVAYPLAMTGIAQLAFPAQANGSVLLKDGKAVGSSLIGQDFSQGPDAPKYFWGRLSATSPVPYTAFNADKATGSSGSNLGPINPALTDNAKARIDALKAADASASYARPSDQRVPVDLVTSSGSGLDPHISVAAAEYQLPRVAKVRGVTEEHVRTLLRAHIEPRQLGILGEPVVNVLELNLALDAAAP
jgi:potassium-transporting ATPase KdpC subunit